MLNEEQNPNSSYSSSAGAASTEETASQDDGGKMVGVYYTLWVFAQAWLVITGALIYSWYPTLITNNSWWQNQCPVTAWTSTSAAITGTGSLLIFSSRSNDNNTVATRVPVQGTWT